MAEKKQVLISTEYASSPVSELSTNKFKSLTSNGISHTATFIMPNFSDLDENQLGEGHASSFGVNTPLTADILKPNLGCQIMLFPVKPLDKDGNVVEMDSHAFEHHISKHKDLLNENVRQSLKDGQEEASLSFQKGETMKDNAKWVSSLGEDGKVGLYKIETRHDEYEYFIYVQTHQTAISKQLYLKNINMKSTTNSQMHGAQKQSLKDFIDGNEYKYMLSVNQRNARRLGQKIAKIYNLKVDTEEDFHAFTENQYEKLPLLAIPKISMEYNVFNNATFKETPSIFYYDNTVCLKKVKGGLIVGQDPTMPLSVVFFDNNYDLKNLENEALFAFPISAGLNERMEDYERTEDKKKLFDAKELSKIDQKIIWEGKSTGENTYNVRTLSKIYKNLDPSNEQQMKVFDKLNPEFPKLAKQLRPVLLKISINA